MKCDGTRAETRFGLSAKRTSPFKSAGVSVQSTTGSRDMRISGSNAGYTVFRGTVLATHSILQFPLHFPSRASPCAIRFQLDSTNRATDRLISSAVYSKRNVISPRFTLPPTPFITMMSRYCHRFCPILCHKCSVRHWVDFRATLDTLGKRKVSSSRPELKPGT